MKRPIGGEVSDLDPFLLLDHFGPVEYGPGEAVGAPDHPHKGFETVSYNNLRVYATQGQCR